jgi:hypothetical protein
VRRQNATAALIADTMAEESPFLCIEDKVIVKILEPISRL